MNPRIVGSTLRTIFYSLLIFPLSFLYAQATHAAQNPIIGEVMWAGSSLSSADEWLEIWNDSDEPFPLAGYTLRGASPSDIVFDATQIIPAHSTFLIANYAPDDLKSTVATSVQLITTSISLSNSALKIELLAPDNTIIDTVGDENTPPAGSSLPTKASMIRTPENNWISATSSTNLKSGTTDLATPGFCDACSAPVIPEPILEPIPEPAPEPEIIIETPTTTDPMLEPLVGTSSTEEIIITEATSTIELPIETPEPIIVTIPTPSSPAPATTPIQTTPLDLHLHAIFPAPESGNEWIELEAPLNAALAQAEDWTLHDASSVIYRFTGANDRITLDGAIWHISLASARLNNSGDIVELTRPDGSVAERMTFLTTPRGTSWIKNSDNTAWIQDPPPAPKVITIQAPATSAPETSTPLILPTQPTIELATITPSTTISTVTTITKTITAKPKPKTDNPKPKTPTKTTVKKVTTPKTNPVPRLVTIDMLTQLGPEIRVTLEGTVGTIPGILSKNQFTIHTPDGRGLLIHGSNKQTSPPFGTKIRLTGTLHLNDDGLSLSMLTKDKWTQLDGKESVEPRIVDLLAPSQEDVWSVIQVTGTVTNSGSGKATLELGGMPITVKIRPTVGYRAERLLKGDTIRITGIVDTRGEDPILYPRQASEIEMIAHAKLASATSTNQTSLPAWTPFGAAGITMAVTEGYKRMRRLTKDRKLKKLAALAQ